MSKVAIGKKSVITALACNVIVGIFKFIGFFVSGSSVMLSEGIHSITDTTNQIFLLIGIKRSSKPADDDFNYGYRGERFFWSLLSACCVFFFGAGVTLYHGFETLIHEKGLDINYWTIAILVGSFITEGFALISASKELKHLAGNESVRKYAKHSGDPTLLAIIFEDSAALLGIVIAIISVLLVKFTGLYIWDAIGSSLIGGLLAIVAVALMNINRRLLIGRSIPPHIKKKIFTILHNQKIVEEIHDFKTVMIATDGYRVKAELEINGQHLANLIMNCHSLKQEYQEIGNYQDFVKFCCDYSDEIVRTLGREIDALEKEIVKEEPAVKHIDLEPN